MISRLRRLFARNAGPAAEPLRGRPAVRREKMYSADSGYVYQYFYEGFRQAERGGRPGCEHIFNCTSDRAARFTVTVFAADDAFGRWQREHGRELTAVERYALVKMALFAGFDASGHLTADVEIPLDGGRVAEHAETLDL